MPRKGKGSIPTARKPASKYSRGSRMQHQALRVPITEYPVLKFIV
jgi:hypothetical protein